MGLLPALATRAAPAAGWGAADRGRGRGCAGDRSSALSATRGAGDARQVDVQARDEEAAAVRHGADGATAAGAVRPPSTRCERLTSAMAARMRRDGLRQRGDRGVDDDLGARPAARRGR